jgi:hypothetical protein
VGTEGAALLVLIEAAAVLLDQPEVSPMIRQRNRGRAFAHLEYV